MRTTNAMQLKALIKKKAEENNISAQLVMQNYMLERLLARISVSDYKENFILKGGFLISAMVGLDTRATMDLDTTIKGIGLTKERIEKMIRSISDIDLDDDIRFRMIKTADIRETDDYSGIRVYLTASYPPISVPLTIDVTTGDKITPKEIKYSFKPMFDEGVIEVFAYNLETVLAEKLETIISRGIANTRPRDFYDVYILYKLQYSNCDKTTLKKAIMSTSSKRGSTEIIKGYRGILEEIRKNDKMRSFWNKYQKEFDYAKDIDFDDICECVESIFNEII